MKKFFYLDSMLLVIGIILFVLFGKNFKEYTNIIWIVVFIACAVVQNIKFYKVVKYPTKSKLTMPTVVNLILIFLGKIQLILLCLRFGYFDSKQNDGMLILVFAFSTLLFLTYTYVYEGMIVQLWRKPFSISEVEKYTLIERSLGSFYLFLTLKDKSFKIVLSPENYKSFLSIYKERLLKEKINNE